MTAPRLAVVGGFGVGMTMRVERAPASGETVADGEFAAGPGGKGSNQAVGAARLGAETALLTAVGSDPQAELGRELWKRAGVDASAVATVDAPTMCAFILVEPDGENRIAVAPGALALLSTADVGGFRDRLGAADVCLVSLEVANEPAFAAVELARELGTVTVLDPAPAMPLPDAVWSSVDFLTPNRGEAAALVGLPDDTASERLLDAVRERTEATVVMTLGTDGCVVDAPGAGREWIAAEEVIAVDTTGAGDAFAAAFAVTVAEGRSAVEAARFATAASAHAVQIAEVIPALPNRNQVNRSKGAPK